MSEKDFQKEMIGKSNGTLPDDSVGQRGEEPRPPVFHRVPCCPQCGEDDLSFFDFGVFLRSDFLGMTSEGEKGCGPVEVEGDYEYVLECRSCGHRVFQEESCSEEQLLEWAIAVGEEVEALTFRCPACGTKFLSETRTGVEIIRDIAAVYTTPGNGEADHRAVIALVPDRQIWYSGPTRYRCPKGHELAKDDGTPVETAEELVVWLKALAASDEG